MINHCATSNAQIVSTTLQHGKMGVRAHVQQGEVGEGLFLEVRVHFGDGVTG